MPNTVEYYIQRTWYYSSILWCSSQAVSLPTSAEPICKQKTVSAFKNFIDEWESCVFKYGLLSGTFLKGMMKCAMNFSVISILGANRCSRWCKGNCIVWQKFYAWNVTFILQCSYPTENFQPLSFCYLLTLVWSLLDRCLKIPAETFQKVYCINTAYTWTVLVIRVTWNTKGYEKNCLNAMNFVKVLLQNLKTLHF